MSREGGRYTLHRGTHCILIVAVPDPADPYAASAAARAQYTEELGRRADAMAAADPLLTPARAMEELQSVSPPAGAPPVERAHRAPGHSGITEGHALAAWRSIPAAWQRDAR